MKLSLTQVSLVSLDPLWLFNIWPTENPRGPLVLSPIRPLLKRRFLTQVAFKGDFAVNESLTLNPVDL